MPRMLKMKVLLIGVLVAFATPNWLSARPTQQSDVTLVPAGTVAVQFGVRTYRVHKPHSDHRATTLAVDLLNADQALLGHWTETRSQDRDTRVTEFGFGGRTVLVSLSGKHLTVTVDHDEVYSGEISPVDPATAHRIEANRDLLELMNAVTADVDAGRRHAERLGGHWAQMSTIPQRLRPAAAALLRWLPSLGQVVYADEGPKCSLDATECENGFAILKSNACTEAKNEASADCSDYIVCIGCCAFSNPDCDCTCLSGDFFCMCVACGARCVLPLPAGDS